MKKVVFKESAMDFLPTYNMINGELILANMDDELKKDFLEDFPEIENEREEIVLNRIKRYKRIVEKLKYRQHNKCQICGFTFEKRNGEGYSEAHHIIRLADNGTQDENNVIIVCANHHRMLHYAKKVKYDTEGNQIKGIEINDVYYVLHDEI